MRHKKLPLFTGYVALLLLLLLVGGTIGYFFYSSTKLTETIVIRFPKTGPLYLEDEMAVQGHSYGIIEGLTLDAAGAPIVSVALKRPLKVHNGYKCYVMDEGLFGKRVIYFENGSSSLPVIPRSDTLSGHYLAGISDILGNAHKLEEVFIEIHTSLDKIYGTDSSYQKVLSIVESIQNAVTPKLQNISIALNAITADTEKAIPAFNDIITKTATQSNKIHKSLEKSLTEIERLLNTIQSTTEKISHKSRTLEESLATIDTTIASAKEKQTINSIQEELTDLGTTISIIHTDAHKLKLLLNKYR